MTAVLRASVDHSSATVDLVNAVMVAGLPPDEQQAAEMLGVGHEQLSHVRDGATEARLDVPSGRWRFWPELGIGIWLSDGSSNRLPRIPDSAAWREHDLGKFIVSLAHNGLYLQDVQLLVGGEWTDVMSASEWLSQLGPALAVRGVASDGVAVGFVVEFHRSGLLRAETSLQADLCFTLACGLYERT